jgi:cell division protease FtsH
MSDSDSQRPRQAPKPPFAPAKADALRNNDGPQPRPPAGPNGPNGGNTPGRPRPGGGLGWVSRILLLLLIAIVVYNVVVVFFNPATVTNPQVELSYSDFVSQIENDNVKDVTYQQGGQISGDFKNDFPKDGKTYKRFTSFNPFNDDQSVQQLLKQHGVQTTGKQAGSSDFWVTLLINILPIAALVALLFFLSRRATQSQQNIFNFGRSRAKLIMEDRPSTTFADVAGVDEAKSELEEVVEFLKTPQKFQRLLARAVAGEAGVPFFSMSGSEFVEVLVGVGASRVRDLFDQAKKSAPSIIFIDEIDAVGRQRGTSLTTNDEREQTLNQLLVEMDGFDARQAVVVIAATNRPDNLDQALLRPGRFDRRVTVDRPDWKGRQAILTIHARSVPLASDVDLQQLARMTTGMVGADLANLVNEAALLAARRNLDRVNMRCFTDALDRIQLGADRPLVLSEEDLRVVAIHEAGHTLVGLLTPHSDPVTKVTIVPRGQALGVTQYTPMDDRYNYSKEYLFGRIMTALGGRGAEQVVIGSITTGAENDLQQITMIARSMVARWGMGKKVGLISYSDRPSPFGAGGDFGNREYSEETAALIDEEAREIIEDAYGQVVQMLTEHKVTLERIALELRRHETVDANQLAQILNETGINPKVLEAAPGVEAIPGGLQSGTGAMANGSIGSATNGSGNGSSGVGSQPDGGAPDLAPGMQP